MPTQPRRSPKRPKRKGPYLPKNAVRNWKHYAIQFTDGSVYVGSTSCKDVMKRIRQHGGTKGAKFARGKKVSRILETRNVGRMTRERAENSENDLTLKYRRRYGYKRVRGGHNAFVKPSLIPNFTPGSTASLVYIFGSLIVAAALLAFIFAVQQTP